MIEEIYSFYVIQSISNWSSSEKECKGYPTHVTSQM